MYSEATQNFIMSSFAVPLTTYFSFLQKSILDRLDAGEVLIGDGGMIFNLEKRGYVEAGNFTPEVVIEHPSAGK